MIEFGFEISADSAFNIDNHITLFLYIPWYTPQYEVRDLYKNLKDTSNSKFIFNDSVTDTHSLDGGNNNFGIIHSFVEREKLCLLPIEFKNSEEAWVNMEIDLKHYNSISENSPNIYCRFLIKPNNHFISTRKKGITKTTIIYDFKVNERRNMPDQLLLDKREKELCNIKSCFCFNILPNKYDFVFLDNASLKSVRTLEYESFRRYLGDDMFKKDELVVVFNKKTNATKQSSNSYSFFSMYSKERIGKAQFTLAILLNIFCGMLFFIASYRSSPKPDTAFFKILIELPGEVYFASAILLISILYFSWPYIRQLGASIVNFVK